MAWLENERGKCKRGNCRFASSCATSLSNALDGNERRSACTRQCPARHARNHDFLLLRFSFLEYMAISDF